MIGVFLWKETHHFVDTYSYPDPFQHDARTCAISDYGASHDNAAKTVKAFAKAFAKCAPGGTVIVPPGEWMTGGIKIPSDVTLRIDKDAVLLFDTNPDSYLPVVPTRYEGLDVMNYQPFLYVPNANHVAIIGEGKLIGNGEAWWDWRKKRGGEKKVLKTLYEQARTNVSLEQRVYGDITRPLRPSFLQFYNSDTVVLDGPTFIDGPMWTIHPVYSKHVTIRNVTVETTGPNTDGIAIDSSEDVTIEKSTVGSGDDAVVIKSGLDDDGWRKNIPSKHIVIRDVTVTHGNSGVTIGSEISGGVEDVSVDRMTFHNVSTGIRLKTVRGRGGYVRHIRYQDVSMDTVKEAAIQLNAQYQFATIKNVGDLETDISDITLNNITAVHAGNVFRVDGADTMPMRDVALSHLKMQATNTGHISNVSNMTLDDVVLDVPVDDPIEFTKVQGLHLVGDISSSVQHPYANLSGNNIAHVTVDLFPCVNKSCVHAEDDAVAQSIEYHDTVTH